MKTKTTQSQQIAYASMLVVVASLALGIIFNSPFYAGTGFGFIIGMVVGVSYFRTKILETQKKLETAKSEFKKEGGEQTK